MEEVLSKLFHERMDVQGAADVMVDSNPVFPLFHHGARPLGLSNRTQDDMLLPNWDNAAPSGTSSRGRLTNERAVLCCLRCHAVRRFRVARFEAMERPGTCLKRSGKRLACAREGLQEMLEGWVKSEDQKDQDRMMKNA